MAIVIKRADCRYDRIEDPKTGLVVKLVRYWSGRDELFALLNMPGAE